MESVHLLTCFHGDDVMGGQGGNLTGTEDDTDQTDSCDAQNTPNALCPTLYTLQHTK